MEIFWESFKDKKIILFLLFLGFLLFLFIIFTGTKIIKQNKLGGVLLLFLGSIFSLLMLFLLYAVFMFGINF
ncbi:hypothetical protein PSN84_002609 [Enterococcus faecalis]|nr:hypothetical protein [Enterococcus faecalis]EKL7571086.1 hypothetical protein [Enterococcus faecalis]EKS9929325.1 hypothetical protein [Enterococcus faecalis]EKS9978870.1 hypothetical protein [Enterococcus faecalis]